MMLDSAYFVKSTPFRYFNVHCKYLAGILLRTLLLKMCMKNFDAVKLWFDLLTRILNLARYAYIQTTAHFK